MVKRERRVLNGKVPQFSPYFLVGFIKDLGFRRIILKCDDEESTKARQDAVIQACVGVEVIPQGPPEGDQTTNGDKTDTERCLGIDELGRLVRQSVANG